MSYISSVSSDVMAYQPATSSGAVNFTGLGNGTDFNEIIDAQLEAESYTKKNYEAKLAETEACASLLDELITSMGELSNTLDDMNSMSEFLEMAVTSSKDGVSGKVTGDIQEGSHTVEVNQLAQNDVWVNTGVSYSEPTDVVTTVDAVFAFECDGEEISIEVPANTTAQQLVDMINSDPVARDLVSADLLSDGDTLYFRLSSKETGADHAIVLSDTTTLGDYSTTEFENVRTAQNAQIKVDGFPSGADQWMERDSNTVDDVIPGLELTLSDVTEGPVNLTVTCDTEVTKENIESFVEEVNSLIYDIQVLSGRVVTYVEDEESGESMEAYTIDSYALDVVYNDLKSQLSMSVVGFSGEYDTYNALSQIGLYTDTNEGSDTFGQLLINEEELDDALEENPYAVAELLSCENTGISDTRGVQVTSTIDGITTPGAYGFEYIVVGGEIVSAKFNGEPATIDGNTVTAAAGTAAAGMVVEISDLSEGSHSADIRVKEGVVPQLQGAISTWTNAENGTLTTVVTTYDADATKLENDIYYQEERLAKMESDLRRKYSALDGRLAYYTNLQSSLTAMISQTG
ncbi:flagellar filament capping protein FliD [Halodesulfovibrio marinisediminis]|uniref:Flagellar hook-associated protein 2 n=1 Tax=Halodesulfovibrio marinisediminis DSM 17456 TaxID=1121457 RepID=A0A1N6GU49_9BACT|nr:flagellar filament capping protein FliD [Halodesulfovibrio marinisediminis]SIO11002.1 flagellar hook-associated protein 2 [Halodesulfovibrio marinisediminis DSM 17456]